MKKNSHSNSITTYNGSFIESVVLGEVVFLKIFREKMRESSFSVEVPMGKWFFEWQVTKNNITSNFYDTIFLSSGEQKFYEINY